MQMLETEGEGESKKHAKVGNREKERTRNMQKLEREERSLTQ